ncbi:MAG TPA: SRPBCC family protein [Actinomycetota bacterium]|nr:SRPBCC family protein [Actinomycetota bacterium]
MTTTTTETAVTTQVYRVYIKATPQAIWDAITKPEWSARYGYGGRADFDLRPGGVAREFASDAMKRAGEEMGYPTPDVIVDGEVIEADPPHRLVRTWRMMMDPELMAEGFTRLTYEISAGKGGVSKLTVIHELDGAPKLARLVSGDREAEGAGGGWNWVLSDLKTLLESGSSMDPGDPLNQGA